MMKSFLLGLVMSALSGGALAGQAHTGSHGGHGAGEAVQHAENVAISAAWSPETPPGAMSSAVYLQLANKSDGQIVLTGASSTAFAAAHVHRSSISGGMASMEMVAQLAIPSGQVAVFEPGGLHIMLMSPSRRFAAGDSFPVMLHFDSGASVEFDVRVVKAHGDGEADRMSMKPGSGS